ncbi:MAG: hypothetical protein IT244_08670, partial [Bacteroidia bacterium]|nr:hypothetical protein [Bacteroidia bacterium]
MRPLLLCILAYLTSPLTAQFRMKLTDSGFVKNNYFVVKAAFKDASGNIKLFGGVKGKISYKKVVWKTINCDPPKDNYFFFNRESVLSAGGSITVIGTYKKKYSDTLTITLPKPIRIVLPDTFTRIKVNEFESIKGTVEYSDGRIVRIEHDETLFSLFELKLPEDVIELFGKIKVPSDKYLRGLEIGVTLKSNPDIKGVYKIMPDYAYSLQFSASGSTGADGYKGSSGADGCADCSDRGEDGLPGEMGGTGGDGGNGPVLEVWLRKRNDSVTLVKVNGDVHHNVLNYVDLAHG